MASSGMSKLAFGATIVAPRRWLFLSEISFTKPCSKLFIWLIGKSLSLVTMDLYLRSRLIKSYSLRPMVAISGLVLVMRAKPA